MSRPGITSAVLLLALAAPGTGEAAVYLIYNCSPTHASPNTNAKLANDITCDPSLGHVGITLNSGADLDMNGKTLNCASGQTCSAAVRISHVNSVVSGAGTIAGSFAKVVDCAAKQGSRVTGIKFDGNTDDGIYDCAHVDRNVLIGETAALRAVTTRSAIPNINNNYIDGFDDGVLYTGPVGSGSVIHNLFSGVGRPIYFQNWAAATVTGNVFLESSVTTNAPIDVGSVVDGSTYGGNICNGHTSGCIECETAGRCTTLPTAPFGF